MTGLILFHPMDPRGRKLGGIETHVRLVLARNPGATLLVGIDETGDDRLGRVQSITFEGRAIDFLPVLRADGGSINAAAQRVTRSLTLRFLLAAMRHIGAVARAARRQDAEGARATCEVERYEFAVLPRLLGRRSVLLVHSGASRDDAMDSLLKQYWFIHRASERVALALADKIFAVNETIATRIAGLSRKVAEKTETLAVPVDTTRFVPTSFEAAGSTFRVCFAGRLDAFKDPPLMFASLALAAERLAAQPVGRFDRLAFDYLGASDPTLVPGFARIAGVTIRHGPCSASEVAAVMRTAHAGLVTSFFEGMPCYLLEMLASGRPVVAIALPQFAPLLEPGCSGRLVARGATTGESASAVAEALLAVAAEIADSSLSPPEIAARAAPFSVDRQMGRLFAAHQELAKHGGQPSESARLA